MRTTLALFFLSIAIVECHAQDRLAEMLRRDELDAALVSVVEVLFTDRYDILDGIAIASLGEVQSVLLAHRRPPPALTRHGGRCYKQNQVNP